MTEPLPSVAAAPRLSAKETPHDPDDAALAREAIRALRQTVTALETAIEGFERFTEIEHRRSTTT